MSDEATQIAGDLSGILAATLSQTVDLCDKQYVRLEQVLNKPWLRHFMQTYEKLYKAEESLEGRKFYFSRQISPFVEHLTERIKLQSKSVGIAAKILVKLDQEKLMKQKLIEDHQRSPDNESRSPHSRIHEIYRMLDNMRPMTMSKPQTSAESLYRVKQIQNKTLS